MTTITNFVQGNFINNTNSEVERPVWVVDQGGVGVRQVVSCFVDKCAWDRKPLIRIDLGLSSLAKINKDTERIKTESGLTYAKLYAGKPNYLVISMVDEKIKPGFLLDLLKNIQHDTLKSQVLKKDKENAVDGWGLLIEGLQTFNNLNQNKPHVQTDIESFVSALSALTPQFRQIVVVSRAKYLSTEVNFALQRISTCLTHFHSKKQQQWNCTSTIRRYTGYFKEQEYTVTVKDGKVKVAKLKVEKPADRTQMHSELFDGLGFKAERDEEAKKKTKELREMIFPHLRIQNQCEKKDCGGGGCACKEPVPQDLIILDEEQEDEDDLDV